MMEGSDTYLRLTDANPDPGGPLTHGYGFGKLSETTNNVGPVFISAFWFCLVFGKSLDT